MARSAFTLLEICLAIMIMVMVMSVAVPALSGVLAQRKAEESFAEFEECVAEARARSQAEGLAYVLVWSAAGAEVRLDGGSPTEGEAAARFDLKEGETLGLELPAAMLPKPPLIWTFWPNGTCEPATIRFAGEEGGWVARYNPITTRAEVEYE